MTEEISSKMLETLLTLLLRLNATSDVFTSFRRHLGEGKPSSHKIAGPLWLSIVKLFIVLLLAV